VKRKRLYAFFGLLAVLLPAFTVCGGTINVDPYSDNMLYEHSIFAVNSVRIMEDVVIHSGSVGVEGDQPEEEAVQTESLQPSPFYHERRDEAVANGVVVDEDVYFEHDTSIYGRSVFINRGASVFNVYADTLINEGEIRAETGLFSERTYPVYLPEVPDPQPGTESVFVNWGERRFLPPGSYGRVSVRSGGTLILSGGRYDMRDLELGYYRASLLVQGQAEIVISSRLLSYFSAYIGPEKGSGINARDIVLFVLGEDGDSRFFRGFPKAAHLGMNSEIYANIFVPNGSLWMLRNSIAKGAFVAKDVLIGYDVEVTLDTQKPKGLLTEFADPNLEAAVREALGISEGPLFVEDLEQLYTLNASGREIKDLSGLEYCVNLMSLVLEYNEITDLGPLTTLSNLQSLNLNDNAVSDTAALATLTGLTRLYLGGNTLDDEDLARLKGLTNLTYLVMDRNQVSDLSPLVDLTQLRSLVLNDNDISDLSPLQGLANLSGLELYNNYISDISPLAGLTNLRVLYLYSNTISDIAPLANLTNLERLVLDYNDIIDISALQGLVNLEVLYLNENRISSLEPLGGLSKLKILVLDSNAISDISALAGLQGLTDLYLGQNQISDISALANLLELSSLYLYINNIRDISALVENCTAGGLGSGDVVYLFDNPLDGDGVEDDLAFLEAHDVLVYAYEQDLLY
jgi:Leucine-rich repeat (LRR) protein